MARQNEAFVPTTLVSESILVFVMVLAVFLLSASGGDTSEGRYHYMVARQIWTQGSLGFEQPLDGTFTVAPNGRTYGSHEIGNTLFMIPLAGVEALLEKAIPRRLPAGLLSGALLTLLPAVYCALTAALLYAMLRVFFAGSIGSSRYACLAFAFSTFVWSYSRIAFDGVLCMCLLTGAMFSMMYFKKTLATRPFVLATLLLGLGVITRLSMVVPLIAFGVYVTLVLWKRPARLIPLGLLAGALLLPFAAWQCYYNHLRTGLWLVSPVQTAQYAHNNGLTGDLAVGLTGLLFSPGKSIFVYIPLALISIVCFRRFAQSYLSEAVFVAILSVLWLLLHSKLASWYGSWGWGPRHMVTITPVLVLPACVNLEWMQEKLWRRSLLLGAITWGFVLSLSSIIGNWVFRMNLSLSEGRFDSLIWSPSQGQAVDMIEAAVSNLRKLVLHTPIPRFPEHSPANGYASNTINVWINSAAYQGAPPIILAAAGFGLLAVAAYCLFALRKIEDRITAKAIGQEAM